MFKFGLKLWSTNSNYVTEAARLFDKGVYQYIELYAVARTYDPSIYAWKKLNIPFVIHAPHSYGGLNLAKKEYRENNALLLDETRNFADALNSEIIIVHPGIAGDIGETVHQIKEINDPRIVVENKPFYALDDNLICNGNSPDELKIILENARVRFCFDIGHAICAANAYRIEPFDYLRQFLKLKPYMYHLSDGDYHGVFDRHDHIGRGNFDMRRILSLLPYDSRITVETQKDSNDSLDDFEADIVQLKKLALVKFIIRPATENDLEDVYHLSNDAVVRKNSFNQNHIPLEHHARWFAQSINDDKVVFYVVRDQADEFIGQVRFNKIIEEQGSYIVNISLVKEVRGIGLGAEILKAASLKIFQEKKAHSLYAMIKHDNKSSVFSFLKAGYSMVSEDSNSFKLRYCAG